MDPKILFLKALFTSLAVVLSGGAVVWGLRSRILASFGVGGFTLYAAFTFFTLGTPLLWMLALLPSWDILNAPQLSGIGGNPYGLSYDFYIKAILVLALHWAALTCLLYMLSNSRGGSYELGREIRHLVAQVRAFLHQYPKMEYVLLAVCLFLCVMNFSIIGWDRVWLSEMSRFETVGTRSMWSVIFNVKTIFPVIVAAGAAATCVVAFGARPLIGIISTLLCALPFLASASRGFTLLMALLFLALFVRAIKGLRIVLLVLAPFFMFYALSIPLVQRGLGYSGVGTVIDAVFLITRGPEGRSIVSRLSGLGANLSQGFPVLVEVLDLKADEADGMKRVPAGYLVVSSLPTISLIDGFSQNYKPFNPRINLFTPYSSIAELAAVSVTLSVAFFSLYFGVLFTLLKMLFRRKPVGALAALIVGLAGIMSLIQMQQYGVRTFTRFYYLTILMGLLSLVLASPLNRTMLRLYRPIQPASANRLQ